MKPFLQRELLDPLCLKWGYGFTDEELADLLGCTPRAIRNYFAPPTAKSHRSPGTQVKMLCAFVHRQLQQQGVPLVNASAIQIEIN